MSAAVVADSDSGIRQFTKVVYPVTTAAAMRRRRNLEELDKLVGKGSGIEVRIRDRNPERQDQVRRFTLYISMTTRTAQITGHHGKPALG